MCCRRCSVDKDTLSGCWNQSVTYYTEDLQSSLNDFASTLIHLSRWKSLQESLGDNAQDFEVSVLVHLDINGQHDNLATKIWIATSQNILPLGTVSFFLLTFFCLKCIAINVLH